MPKRAIRISMPDYRLSKRAGEDLANIADFTIQTFGIAQSRLYRDTLRRCFSMLAKSPTMGRNAEYIEPYLRRFEHKSHVIFYRPEEQGILIIRVLHSSMDVLRHL